MSTFVYFMQAGGERGAIKIGYSQNVEKRLEQLRTGNHLPIALLAKFEHERAAEIEKRLHEEFAEFRLEGEWFTFDSSISKIIDAWQLIERDQGRYSASPNDTMRVMSEIRASTVRDALHKADWWVVEWSDKNGDCQIQTLICALSMVHDALLFGRHEISDYVIVAICETADEADAMSVRLIPCLQAMRAARRLGLGEGWKWWGGPG